MTNVPTECRRAEAVHRIDNFEIMAIPFFILAGNFLTHGGVARRMINFAPRWSGTGTADWARGRDGLRAVRGGVGILAATVIAIGSIMMPAMVDAGLSQRFGAGVITTSGALGVADSAVDRDGDLLASATGGSVALDPSASCVVGLGRADVHGRRHSGIDARRRCLE